MLLQIAVLREARKNEILNMAEKIVEGKLAKRRKLDPDFDIGTIGMRESDKIVAEELAKISDPGDQYLTVQINTGREI